MIEKVKKDILSFLSELNVDVGNVFPVKPFFEQRAKKYSPPESDAIEPALNSLVNDGTLESRDGAYFLTENGLDRIYPGDKRIAVEFVKSDLLDFLREMTVREGHVLPSKPFMRDRVSKYNPKQKDAVNEALAQLVAEGLLETREQGYFVTETGYKAVYNL